jgi:hypothetical protein
MTCDERSLKPQGRAGAPRATDLTRGGVKARERERGPGRCVGNTTERCARDALNNCAGSRPMMSTSGCVSAVGCLRVAALRLRRWLQWIGEPRALDPRVAASITLAGVAISAGAGFMVAPRSSSPAAMMTTITTTDTRVAATDVADLPRGPVKIIGGAPRSENCADQVWPYIERRCLTLAADRVPTVSAANPQARPSPATARLETIGAAFVGDDAQADPPRIARPRVATAYLSLPQRDSAWQTDGWTNPAAEEPVVGKPRQRIGRRAHRSRFGRGWGWRHSFGSLF